MNQVKMQLMPTVVELALDLQPIGGEWDKTYEPIIVSGVGTPSGHSDQPAPSPLPAA